MPTCPECGGDAVYDTDDENDREQLLCLNKDCLYWEYTDTGERGGKTVDG